MDKSRVQISKKGKVPRDTEYWLQRHAWERILMVEILRTEYHQWTNKLIPRLQNKGNKSL